jgi:hypothetical protein
VLTGGNSVTRKVAGRPEPRTVEVALGPDSDFPGWWCRAKADFPVRVLEDLQSGALERVIAALGRIIVEHNFPGEDGELAATLSDVDPARGLIAITAAISDGISSLPNR